MSFDYQIAIPSYKRSHTLEKKTLQMLDHLGVDPSIVTIFVADQEEFDVYSKHFAGHKYGNNIKIAVPGISGARNFITHYYPEGTRLVMMDDDATALKKVDTESGKLIPIDSLVSDFVLPGFEACEKNNTKMFGLYPAPNGYFMQGRPEQYVKLTFIIGCCFGVIVDHDPALDRLVNNGEDLEASMRYYQKFGCLVRLNHVTMLHDFDSLSGGLQEVRTPEYVNTSIRAIADMFPDFCDLYIRKSNGRPELRLKDKRKNAKSK